MQKKKQDFQLKTSEKVLKVGQVAAWARVKINVIADMDSQISNKDCQISNMDASIHRDLNSSS